MSVWLLVTFVLFLFIISVQNFEKIVGKTFYECYLLINYYIFCNKHT